MDIQIKTIEDVKVAILAGDIDAKTAPIVTEKVLPLAQNTGSKILLDMTEVAYMSSAGLRMLLSLYRQATAKDDSKIALVGLSEDIEDTMSVTGFLDFFTICPALNEGLEALR